MSNPSTRLLLRKKLGWESHSLTMSQKACFRNRVVLKESNQSIRRVNYLWVIRSKRELAKHFVQSNGDKNSYVEQQITFVQNSKRKEMFEFGIHRLP